jgi:hypothetical protein
MGRWLRGEGADRVGTPVDQQLLLRNEYLVAENRIFKVQLEGRLRLSDAERTRLGEVGHRLGRKALGEVAIAALPDTKSCAAHPRVGHSPILDIMSLIKRSAMFCAVTVYRRRRSASVRRPGLNPYELASRCWRGTDFFAVEVPT